MSRPHLLVSAPSAMVERLDDGTRLVRCPVCEAVLEVDETAEEAWGPDDLVHVYAVAEPAAACPHWQPAFPR